MRKPKNSLLVIFATLSTFGLSASANGDAKREIGIDFFPAEVVNAGTPDCMPHGKDCLLFLSDRPIETRGPVTFRVDEERQTVAFFVGGETTKAINELVKKYPNKRLALTFRGKIISAPKIRVPLTGEKFELTFDSQKSFEEVKSALWGTRASPMLY